MTAAGNNDAAALANAEDVIAQRDPSKLHELIAVMRNGVGPASLTSTFLQAATDADAAEHLTRILTVQNQQQQDRVTLQQHAEEKKEKDRREEAWLESMTPEYRQAYGELMTTVKDANREYNQDREILAAHRKKLEAEAQEIDDQALHLSDGSRAYKNAEGELVDRNGVPLKGKNATEAKALAQQRGGNVIGVDRVQFSDQALARSDRLVERIDADQAKANRYGKEATNPEKPDVAKTRAHNTEVTKDKAADHAATTGLAGAEFGKDPSASKDKKEASLDGAFDLESAPAPASASTDRHSFASTVDGSHAIKANGLTTPFNAATQTSGPAPATVPQLPKPASAPAPA